MIEFVLRHWGIFFGAGIASSAVEGIAKSWKGHNFPIGRRLVAAIIIGLISIFVLQDPELQLDSYTLIQPNIILAISSFVPTFSLGLFFLMFTTNYKIAAQALAAEISKSENQAQSDLDEKKCPDCAEMVKVDARKCRYCGYRFDAARTTKVGEFEPGVYVSGSGVKIRIRPDNGVTIISWPENANKTARLDESYADFSSFWAKYKPLVQKKSNFHRVE